MIDWNKWFYYDESSPSCLRHSVDKRTGVNHSTIVAKKDSPAGSIDSRGHYQVKLNNKLYQAHRVVMVLHGADVENLVVDHIDGNSINNKISNLRLVSHRVNMRNSKLNNKSYTRVSGVTLREEGNKSSYIAQWYELNGKHRSKRFSINKLGIMVAFRDAVIHRQKMIEELNAQGAGYTSRHGKEPT